MMMPGRQFSAGSGYRYGFNGKENDTEVKGEGNQQDYGFRIYDPRLGRFLSVDPLTKKFVKLSPYQFASNRPVLMIDLDGLEGSLGINGSALVTQPAFSLTEFDSDGDYRPDYGKGWAGGMLGTLVAGATVLTAGRTTPFLQRVGSILLSRPQVVTAITSTGTLAAKYGPDIANFVYGATTGDATEPIPTNSGSQAADAGVGLRTLFKKGNVVLDFYGGSISRFKSGVSIDPVAEFSSGGFKGTHEQFAEIFKNTKFKQIVAENPYGDYNYLNSASELLESGGTITIRGSGSNKFFNKLLSGSIDGYENFTLESKKLIEPIGKTTTGKNIESKEFYEIILRRK